MQYSNNRPDRTFRSTFKTLFVGTGVATCVAASATLAAADQTPQTPAANHLKVALQDHDDLVWIGHDTPDTDSFVAAILAAHLYGGTATFPGAINPESRFALQACGAQEPPVIQDFTDHSVGVVDFNQVSQLPAGIDESDIVAIIDHHAIGGTPLNLSEVVSIDIRPWGSTATILADQAAAMGQEFPADLACLATAAILSDTIDLTMPTTTQYDIAYAQQLAATAGIDDLHDFAQQMLMAKSDLSGMAADEIVLLDYKNSEFAGQKVGIGVAETLTAQDLIDRRDDLKSAMTTIKGDTGLDHLIFAIVDSKNKNAYLLWGDETDQQIVTSAFGEDISDDMIMAENVISRKNQIAPAIQKAVEEGAKTAS